MLVSRNGFKAGATKTRQRPLEAAVTPTARPSFLAKALSLQTWLESPVYTLLHVFQLSHGNTLEIISSLWVCCPTVT